jgi:hypothetical protein
MTATRLKTAIQIEMSVKAILVSSLKRPCDGDQECDLDHDYLDWERDFYCDYQYGDAEPLCESFIYYSLDPWPASPDTHFDSG